jgi:type I restriction enzyme, S subunit
MSKAKKWEVVQLKEVMASRTGSVDPSKFPDESFDLYSIPAFDIGKFEVREGSEIGSTKQIVQTGDVLLSKIVPHIRRAWIVGPQNDRRLIASGEWIVFRDKRFYPPYLRQLLISDLFHSQFMATVAGVGGSLLRARPAQVAQIAIPLPPLPEQKRIAAILDSADAIRNKRKAAIAKLDQLAQSVFLEMFGDPVRNEKGWPYCSLGESISIRHGFAFQSEHFNKIGHYILLTPGHFYEDGGFRERGEKTKFYDSNVPAGYILKKTIYL